MKNESRVQIRTRNEYGALVVLITGVVDLAGIREVRHAMFRGLVTGEVERVLTDFSAASFELSRDDWCIVSEQSASPHAVRVKAALLVPAEVGPAAWTHCDYLNRRGHIRIAFTDPVAAYRWAQVRRVARLGQAPAGAPRNRPPL